MYVSKVPFDLLSRIQAPILKDISLLSQMNRATLAFELSPEEFQKGGYEHVYLLTLVEDFFVARSFLSLRSLGSQSINCPPSYASLFEDFLLVTLAFKRYLA